MAHAQAQAGAGEAADLTTDRVRIEREAHRRAAARLERGDCVLVAGSAADRRAACTAGISDCIHVRMRGSSQVEHDRTGLRLDRIAGAAGPAAGAASGDRATDWRHGGGRFDRAGVGHGDRERNLAPYHRAQITRRALRARDTALIGVVGRNPATCQRACIDGELPAPGSRARVAPPFACSGPSRVQVTARDAGGTTFLHDAVQNAHAAAVVLGDNI